MKKQLFSLILSAAIFTTNPLFAMETNRLEDKEGCIVLNPASNTDLSEGKKKKLSNTYSRKEDIPFIYSYKPSAAPNFRFENIVEIRGIGLLSVLPFDIIIDFKDPVEKLLTLSGVSKEMYIWCQNPELWKGIADKVTLKLVSCSPFSIKDQVLTDHADYLNLFSIWGVIADDQSDKPITYMLRKSQFKEFLQTPCVTTWFPNFFEKNINNINYVAKNYKAKPQSYFFSKGSKDFVLYVPNKGETVEEALEKRQHFTFKAGHSGLFNGEAFTCGMMGNFIIKEIKPIALEGPASESE